ncbi:pyruvate kinase [Thioalbus denitrificans]|uniref:pyruvate kinase n=1 Tax=Thioalbus denitrificans TaxID=547122 RepID=A0A369BLH5_9GAMM|nr:pyruvate kinase [Thioalbus denitrificans]RCX22430.1 pyruvate kinase [Thioalbus denitrificans]
MNLPAASIPDTDTTALADLLEQVRALRRQVLAAGQRRLETHHGHYPDGFSPSALNLAHYLALRAHDLRTLQDRLADAGLSSLGRCESHVLHSLDKVAGLLSLAVSCRPAEAPEQPAPVNYAQGRALLRAHAEALCGPRPARGAYIMVTLPGEAARDPELTRALLARGMDCARINCAHDGPPEWTAMIANLRRAEAQTGRRCRVLMDLAGHKIRTGAIGPEPGAVHVKPRRDRLGRVTEPATVLLLRPGAAPPPGAGPWCFTPPEALFNRLGPGCRLHFTDTRGKSRTWEVTGAAAGAGWLVRAPEGSYVGPGTRFRLDTGRDRRPGQAWPLSACTAGPAAMLLEAGDPLLLTRDTTPGHPGRRDCSGVVVESARIACTCPEALTGVRPGAHVWFDDGRLGTVVEASDAEGLRLRVTRAGPRGVRLKPDRGINFPDTPLSLPALSAKDLRDLDFVAANADLVGFSFVQSLEDMERLLAELAARGAPRLPVVAKIETRLAVANLPEILLGTLGRHPLGVMIARGDLAVELGGERMAEIQEEILWLCEAAHVPAIWATQVLESLAKKGVASRPELTDAAMGVRAECVMLNKGPHILEALGTLDDILTRMRAHQRKKSARLRALHW